MGSALFKRAAGLEEASPNHVFSGPRHKRSCTDVIFLLIFLAYLGGMVYACVLAYSRGDPNRLIYGQDSWGNACNQPYNKKVKGVPLSGRNTQGLSQAFYFNPLAIIKYGESSTVICVSDCPGENMTTVADLQNLATKQGICLCRYDMDIEVYSNGSVFGLDCPSLPLKPHVNVLNRCIPKSLITTGTTLAKLLGNTLNSILDLVQAQCEKNDFLDAVVSDIEKSWKEIAYLCAIALGLALIVTFLMPFVAFIIIWALVIGSVLGTLAGTGYCWYRYYVYRTDYDALSPDNQTSSLAKQMDTWLIIAICVTIVSTIVLLILLVVRKRIALVVQLFKEAGKAIAKMPFMLLQPFLTLVFTLGSLTLLVYLFLFIETAGDPKVYSNGQVAYAKDEVLKYMKWYYILGILWIIQFALACHLMVIAGAVAIWYFCRDKTYLGWPIFVSVKRLVLYHLGSVAFGSLIIALIQLFRLILLSVQRRLHNRAGPLVDFLLKCLQCCLWCFEKILKFINWNAYIMVAIHGVNFCQGARRGFLIVVSNIVRVGAINSVGAFTLFMGKLGIVAITVVIGMEIFLKDNNELCYVWVPLILAGVFAFLVADAFLSIYGLAIDTIFLCFCEDSEHNNGVDKPYYMSKGLMQYVVNSKEALENLKARKKAGTQRQEAGDFVPPTHELHIAH